MQFESSKWIAIERDMFAPFAVAGLAGDPEFSHARVPDVIFYKSGLSLSNMTIHARAIPCSNRVIFFQFRRDEKCFADRSPHFFGDHVPEWKLFQRPPLSGFGPQNLKRVRTG